MARKRGNLSEKAIAAALKASLGNISQAARNLSVERSGLHDRIAKSETLKTILHDAREGMVDNAESALHRAVTQGEGWAVCFTLKTQGKARGYVERQEIQQEGRVQVTLSPGELTDEQLAAIAAGPAGGSQRITGPQAGPAEPT
jgi:hypothetical protein